MIALAALVLMVLAIFGIGVSQVAARDLFFLETQLAAQRGAEAAASRAANLLASGVPAARVRALARTEAYAVSSANITRGTPCPLGALCDFCRFALTIDTGQPDQLVVVTVTVCTRYGGFAGPATAAATAEVAVPKVPSQRAAP